VKLDFSGKVCVITGASRGIGRALCKDFAAEGATVVGAARNKQALDALSAEIKTEGGAFHAITADLSRVADCERAIGEALTRFGRIDVLINNMGVGGAYKFIRDLTPAEWQMALDTNLTSVYACIHFAAGAMMERRGGAIINVSSIGTKIPAPKRVDYVATKMGMVGITRVLAHELGPYDITVNAISPGLVDNERGQEAQERLAKAWDISFDKARKALLSRSPLGRIIPQSHISAMVRFLASDLGRSITGQDIDVAAGVAF
jgi:3-oxoacyl-[acyl-carrier protein] reductase